MSNNILSLLVCPVTKGRLVYDNENNMLISSQAQLVFSVEEGVPNMLVDQAMSLADYKTQFPDSKFIEN